MEFLIAWNEEDLVRLFWDYLVLRRKNATLIHKLKPAPLIGILCPREDLETVILERIREEGFKPAEGATITWKTRKGLSAQIKVVGDPDARIPEPESVVGENPSSDIPVPPVELDPSMFPPGTDIATLQAAAEDDLLRDPITGMVKGTTKDRKTMDGETPAKEEKSSAKAKKKSPVSRRRRRKGS